MKEIPLSQGLFTQVDDEDFEKLSQFKWYANKMGVNFYVRRHHNKKTIIMHRVILNSPKGMQTDHIDGNGLNNQKSNLKIVTARENQQNRHNKKSSRFVGASLDPNGHGWQSKIYYNGKSRWLGYYKTDMEAHLVYLIALNYLIINR